MITIKKFVSEDETVQYEVREKNFYFMSLTGEQAKQLKVALNEREDI